MGKLDKLIARVKRTNKAFKEATRAEKRVILAQDVISALKAKAMDAEEGSYLIVDEREVKPGDAEYGYQSRKVNETIKKAEPGASFRDLLPDIPDCKVCAKGALFVSCVARRNQVTNTEAGDIETFYDGSLSAAMGGIFSNKQLDLIEAEFEREDIHYSFDWDWEPKMAFRAGPAERMTAIMKNIIRNKGTFAPREGE